MYTFFMTKCFHLIDESCNDQSDYASYCKIYKNANLCHYHFIAKNCKKTCKYCKCEDTPEVVYWCKDASKWCGKTNWMKTHCKKTCGICS